MSQGWSKIFNRINWLNRPSTNTPLNATNLNAGDSAIDKLDDRIITLDTVKADMQVVNGMVADVSLNSNTGVITVRYKNGSHVDYDTNLEKIAVNFSYDYVNQRLVLTLSDGSKQYVDMSALITQYEFKDSTTIAFSVDSTGKVSASVKNGSITDAMLETGYLANITAQATKAESMANSATTSSNSAYDNAKLSQSYAIGGSGIREGEDVDNAMYYYEQAKKTDIGQIRSEVDELNSNLDVLQYGDTHGGYNIFKDTTWFVGRHMAENGISYYPETGSAYSDYISIVEPNTYYISSSTHPKSTVFEYDANKSFIKYNGWKKDNNTPCVLSGNCAYIRISFNGASSNIQPSNVMLAKTSNLPYVPYIPSVKMLADEVDNVNSDLSGLSFSVSGTTLSITDGTNTWTLSN